MCARVAGWECDWMGLDVNVTGWDVGWGGMLGGMGCWVGMGCECDWM